jgi:hypothetical protein
MKKNLLLIILICLLFSIHTNAQQKTNEIDTTATLDMLVVPNSPAFTLLGISPTTVDKPTTPSDFAFSIVNATNGLSGLPKNYAIEIAPIPLLFQKKKNYNQFANKNHKFINTLSQTFIISAGFTTNDTVTTTINNYIKTRSGIGFKISLLRGKIDTAFDDYKTSIISVRNQLDLLHATNIAWIDSVKKNDLVYILLAGERTKLLIEMVSIVKDVSIAADTKNKKNDSLKTALTLIDQNITSRLETIKAEQINQQIVKAQLLKKEIENIKFKRYGLMLDIAGGAVLGFRNDDFQNSVVQQYSFWINGGYSLKKGFDFVVLARYNTNVGVLIGDNGKPKDQTSYDFGGKVDYSSNDKKFTIGAEGIVRVLSDTAIYRYTFNASYQIKQNQALTFSIGKNFNSNKTNLGGTLIAALNYVVAFGTKRTVVPK